MEHRASSQDKSDSVPLSSSPATIPDSEGEVSTTVEFPPSSPDVTTREEPSTIPSVNRGQGDATCTTDTCTTNGSNLPLLSPFAVLKSEPSLTHENIRTQSITLQRVLHSIPDSPPVWTSSPEPTKDAPPSVSNVLQSPFGVHSKSASSWSDDLFVSPPVQNALSKSLMAVDNQIVEEYHMDVNALSDSGESIVGQLPTPKASKIAPRIASSSPHVSRTVGADANYIKSDKRHIQSIARDLSLTLELSNSDIKDSSHLEEVESKATSMSRPLSPDSQSGPSASHALGPQNLLERRPSAVTLDSPNKRAREADEKDLVPASKRMTLASQQRQHKKLASPFRSPLLSKPNTKNVHAPVPGKATSSYSYLLSSSLDTDTGRPSTPVNKFTRLSSMSARLRSPLSSSAKAKAPFKSPLVKSSPMTTSLQISNSRTIQELERKVQLLKRAIKIKNGGEEEKLEQLVKKWRAAGREAAWELWQIVRDNGESSEAPYPGTNSKSQGSSFNGWGWANVPGTARTSGWGWDQPAEGHIRGADVDSDELESPTKVEREIFNALRRTPAVSRTSMLPPTPRGAYFEQRIADDSYDTSFKEAGQPDLANSQDEARIHCPSKTLGAMLHQLGIAHETLGWNEDDGDFIDN